MSHPAAELVGNALQRIRKIGATKKHPALASELQELLDHIDETFSPLAAASAASAAGAPRSPGAKGSQPGTPPPPQSAPQSDSGSPPASQTAAPPVADASAEAQAQPAAAQAASPPSTPHTEASAGADAASYAAQLHEGLPLTPRSEMAISDAAAGAVMRVFRLAVETGRAQIVEVVLDCIQKLIAFKFLQVRAGLAALAGAGWGRVGGGGKGGWAAAALKLPAGLHGRCRAGLPGTRAEAAPWRRRCLRRRW
jgi:hypothetical protein